MKLLNKLLLALVTRKEYIICTVSEVFRFILIFTPHEYPKVFAFILPYSGFEIKIRHTMLSYV